MKFTLGTKVSMTQVFDSEGVVYPATVLSAGPLTITALRTNAKDGYTAVQVGFGEQKESRVNKAQKKHGNFRHFGEFRVGEEELASFKLGDKIDLSVFKEGDFVTVSSVSKGKGFQGGVKRHHFKGGPRTHGQKHSEREVGSINGGGRVGGGGVAKGKRMPGRMGGDMVTVKNLKVLQVRPESNELVLHGSLPGPKGVLVSIQG
ncbi:MAG: 50S ribosomal protein L3 [Candidatus Taylorbacteria bacterium CG10_big_fil_rev_8_21_14_0_10_41_48]|uniref:50S ribosomal protein L3 n=1 Tax=Candidatus Taylorbacteria bacterium CG10_big_fil_rev_8_21_14_0_10_41_48 TaxID=1975024 RepID=A0A2M8LCU0_9BACT|nr:MAG: 50S ribosomal protein L3 [Candidatus Taylorbacteria bacterium CG10_big_fil_rev_8_21_14_0_10_41_48]